MPHGFFQDVFLSGALAYLQSDWDGPVSRQWQSRDGFQAEADQIGDCHVASGRGVSDCGEFSGRDLAGYAVAWIASFAWWASDFFADKLAKLV